jgi:hypothetical protein
MWLGRMDFADQWGDGGDDGEGSITMNTKIVIKCEAIHVERVN